MTERTKRLPTLLAWLVLLPVSMVLFACQPIQPVESVSSTMPAEPPPTPVIPPEGLVVSMWIGPERQSCMGVVEMMCMQVKWSEDGAWENFFSSIDGFIFVPGYNYELLVRQHRVDPTPADASSIAWSLEEIVSRTPAFEGDPLPLTGTDWHLLAFGEHEMVVFDPVAMNVTAHFGEDSSLSGQAACNRYMGTYTVDGDILIVNPLATTRMMCEESLMAVEAAFLSALEGEHQFQINGDKLEVIYAAGELIFQGSAGE